MVLWLKLPVTSLCGSGQPLGAIIASTLATLTTPKFIEFTNAIKGMGETY
jgi:hypothetical protein